MKVLTDLFLAASDSSTTPSGPEGYDLIGNWDVDKGGAGGTDGSSGKYMMALYACFADVSCLSNLTCIKDVFLTATDDSNPVAPDNQNYRNIAHWDADSGGAVGTNGSRGKYMVGMYTREGAGGDTYISDVQLTASDNSFPNTLGTDSDYRLIGYWDADKGGAVGTDQNSGAYMMGLFVQNSLV